MSSPLPASSATGSTRRPTSWAVCLLLSRPGRARPWPEIRDAPDRTHAEQAIAVFARDYGPKWPKAVAKLGDDAKALLCLFDFPAEHW
jgi:putative transposase